MLYGKGAGMMPTASAVVSDVLQIAKDLSLGNAHSSPPRFYGGKGSSRLIKMSDTTNKYYLRFQAEDRPGVLGKITGSLGKHGISIESVIQKGRHLGGGDVPVVIMTHEALEKNLLSSLREIDRFSTIRAKTTFIRIEDI
jgi:homoserine dehydrogenase